MEGSEREDPPSSAEDDVECRKVSTRIAGVTLESDSLPESPSNVVEERMARRKKRMKRHNRGQQMDVDPTPTINNRQSKHMDWDGAESHISSSDESFSDTRGQEADDEQSDWVGYAGDVTENETEPVPDRRPQTGRRNVTKTLSTVQKQLERFALQGPQGEAGFELRMRDRPTSIHLNRLLNKYHLEVVRRQRGAVYLRRKQSANSSSAR
ncbi:unnamed protein product [Caenorhabditis auriculariae]|uniref:Uncharacterized protein n=1 Tax=Caenorhabditis auriculariae TaxID=2777116 RepID=A0A8S1HMQ3_9PELO|nr:unnamed protein product [Caenorhabditis auriculariae]